MYTFLTHMDDGNSKMWEQLMH